MSSNFLDCLGEEERKKKQEEKETERKKKQEAEAFLEYLCAVC